jgi:putative protease
MELVAPAGNIDKLRFALAYGADAVYAGAERYSLRARAENFAFEALAAAIRETHAAGKRFYLTLNSFFNDAMLIGLQEFLEAISAIPAGDASLPDAFVMSDIGAMALARRVCPHIPIHISTQANTLNAEAARYYYEHFGARRVVLARELSLIEIERLAQAVPDIEIEAFVHGAMCVAYSGRCIISNYLTSRAFLAPGETLPGDPDRIRSAGYGDCSQTCRWSYSLVEEKREGVVLHVIEDETGTMLLSSRDLCMVDHLAALRAAGVHAVKIEGRMKSVHYAAVAAGVYRAALDALAEGRVPSATEKKLWHEELALLTKREYTTGFYAPDGGGCEALWPSRDALRSPVLVAAIVLAPEGHTAAGIACAAYRCRALNAVKSTSKLSAILPGLRSMNDFAFSLRSAAGEEIPLARAGEEFILLCEAPLEQMAILRMTTEK